MLQEPRRKRARWKRQEGRGTVCGKAEGTSEILRDCHEDNTGDCGYSEVTTEESEDLSTSFEGANATKCLQRAGLCRFRRDCRDLALLFGVMGSRFGGFGGSSLLDWLRDRLGLGGGFDRSLALGHLRGWR